MQLPTLSFPRIIPTSVPVDVPLHPQVAHITMKHILAYVYKDVPLPPPPPERKELVTRLRSLFLNHIRRPIKKGSTNLAATGHPSDFMLNSSEFHKVQELSRRSFTWDACCSDSGNNALCKNFSSPLNSFLQADVSGQHVWLHPPVDIAEACVKHMIHCWHNAPHTTSACIMLPDTLAYLVNTSTVSMRLLRKYNTNSPILLSPHNRSQQRIKNAMRVYYLSPAPTQHTLHMLSEVGDDDLLSDPSPTPLAFTFHAACTACTTNDPDPPVIHTTVLADSGASTRFASLAWVTKHGIPIKRSHQNWTVTVANNEEVQLVGSVDVTIDIQGYRDKIRLLVMPMAPTFDIILGSDWLHNAV